VRSETAKEDTSNPRLTNKSIYIVGPQSLQNEMMARILEQETGAQCLCADAIDQLPSLAESEATMERLILIDGTGEDLNGLLVSLEAEVKERLSTALVALFNVIPGLGIEENTAGKVIKGVFYESDPLKQFLKGVYSIFEGELWFSREIMTRFVLKRNLFSPKVMDVLTHRETEILSLIAVGAKNEEIGEKLFVTTNTVKTHIYNIFKKINVSNRLQAALWAAKNL